MIILEGTKKCIKCRKWYWYDYNWLWNCPYCKVKVKDCERFKLYSMA
jgi:hypothetical protein